MENQYVEQFLFYSLIMFPVELSHLATARRAMPYEGISRFYLEPKASA